MSKKIFISIILQIVAFSFAFAQSTASQPEMAETFRKEGKIYVVIAVASIILTGIVVFLIMLEKRINKLEKQG